MLAGHGGLRYACLVRGCGQAKILRRLFSTGGLPHGDALRHPPAVPDRPLRSIKLGRRARQFFQLIANYREHLAYRRELQAARRVGVADADRLTAIKYTGDYLSASLSLRARRDSLKFHYRFLTRAMTSAAGAAVWQRGAAIWARDAEGERLEVTLSRSTLAPMEGESQLSFLMGNRALCTLTFSFVHGRDLQLPCDEAIFIGGLQGGLDCRQEIRRAAKINGEVSPAAMLLLAAEALANILDVEHMVGVSTQEQAAAVYSQEKIVLSYDRLWQELGAHHARTGFYVKAIAVTEEADKAITGSHHSRTRRRRVLKKNIRREIEERIAALFGMEAPPAPAAGQSS